MFEFLRSIKLFIYRQNKEKTLGFQTKKVNKNVLCVLRNRIIGKFSYMKRLEKLYLFFLVFHLSLYGCQQMEPTASSSAIQDSATQTPPLVDQQISLNQVLD
ncbi:hypothetical protein CMK17_12710 [Candidatus Poribacteria bacterium]|nr:hypothetical protein [Candidatus Poribacteria bacterium]